jgi:hypothetical protein
MKKFKFSYLFFLRLYKIFISKGINVIFIIIQKEKLNLKNRIILYYSNQKFFIYWLELFNIYYDSIIY